ncbi:winged helix-turn-helix transcriptional regulator [Nocardia sp. NPDC056611]|uniref:winged helix-turn-helix transcriptional regulator n=1 Tax=Nocardia sp. NPDC056611 TaxID=3345877 RepID=UPI00366E25CB
MSDRPGLRIPLDECGLARTAAVLGDRWTLLVLREAHYGITRFDDMRADLDIPRNALSTRLKTLVDTGLLAKSSYREPGARTRDEYVLTAMGRELLPALIALMQWGDRHLSDEDGPLEFRHAGCDGIVTAQLTCECGQSVQPAELTPRVR